MGLSWALAGCCCSSCHPGVGLQVVTELIRKSEYDLMVVWALFGMLELGSSSMPLCSCSIAVLLMIYYAMDGSVMYAISVANAWLGDLHFFYLLPLCASIVTGFY